MPTTQPFTPRFPHINPQARLADRRRAQSFAGEERSKMTSLAMTQPLSSRLSRSTAPISTQVVEGILTGDMQASQWASRVVKRCREVSAFKEKMARQAVLLLEELIVEHDIAPSGFQHGIKVLVDDLVKYASMDERGREMTRSVLRGFGDRH